MELNFKIQQDRLISGSVLEGHSGNVDTYTCKFEILDNTNFTWFCVFKNDESAYQQLIYNNKCFIPHEVLKNSGKIQIGCYATYGAKRVSTNWLTFDVKEGAYSLATGPKIPTPDVWEVLVKNHVPYIGKTGTWFIYDNEKRMYVDSQKPARGEKGDKGEAGYSDAKRFPVYPQIDITVQEPVMNLFIDKLKGEGLSAYNFTQARVLVTNSPQDGATHSELRVYLNKLPLFLNTATSFLYNSKQQYWAAHFDLLNFVALGQNTSVIDLKRKAQALMATNYELFALMDFITAFEFQSLTHEIPVGTNIKIWLK